jgi:hypothetical protein
MSPVETTGKVALAVAMILVVAVAIYSQSDAQPAKPVCVTDEDRVQIRRQVLSAVDDALHDHMKALFIGWIKDPRDQPARASAGIQAAIVAYQRARADALKWAPPSC